MSSILLIDLETILDTTLPAPPEASAEEKGRGSKAPFPPPPLHRIVCIGWAVLSADYMIEGWGVMGDKGETEAEIVSRLIGVIESLDPVVATLNGRGFDMPVLAARAFVLGLTFRWYYAKRFGARYRYSREDTYDIMDFLSDHGAAPRAGLDVWARACGWPGKGETKGSSVQEMYDAKICKTCRADLVAPIAISGWCEGCKMWVQPTNRLKEICDYCGGVDIPQSIAILLRTELLRGALDMGGYRRAADALLEKAEADSRTAPVAFAVDRARFLIDDGMNEREAAE